MSFTEIFLLPLILLAAVAALSIVFKGRMEKITPFVFVVCAFFPLISGLGFRFRELFEAPFAHLDSMMWVLCGTVFSFMLYANGTYAYIFQKIVSKRRCNFLRMLYLVLFIALPGMLSGTMAASVCTTGVIAGKYLIEKGAKKAEAVEVVAIGSLLGMLLPPLCLPAMTLCASSLLYTTFFEGYFLLCLVVALPALLLYCALACKRVMGGVEVSAVEDGASATCLIPLLAVALLIICHNFLYTVLPFLGYPLIFTIGFILAVFLAAKKTNPLECAACAVREAAPEVLLMLAFAAASEMLLICGASGTAGAKMVLLSVDPKPLGLACMAAAALLGAALGPCLPFMLIACVAYTAVSTGVTLVGSVALGFSLCLPFYLAARGGILSRVKETLGAEEVGVLAVLRKTAVPVLMLFGMCALMLLAQAGFAKLML